MKERCGSHTGGSGFAPVDDEISRPHSGQIGARRSARSYPHEQIRHGDSEVSGKWREMTNHTILITTYVMDAGTAAKGVAGAYQPPAIEAMAVGIATKRTPKAIDPRRRQSVSAGESPKPNPHPSGTAITAKLSTEKSPRIIPSKAKNAKSPPSHTEVSTSTSAR